MDAKLEELSFTYFPENYRWSHGLLIGLNMAPWGGAEIGEVNRVGLRLKSRVGDDDAWFREWAREARKVEDVGRQRIAEALAQQVELADLREAWRTLATDRGGQPRLS